MGRVCFDFVYNVSCADLLWRVAVPRGWIYQDPSQPEQPNLDNAEGVPEAPNPENAQGAPEQPQGDEKEDAPEQPQRDEELRQELARKCTFEKFTGLFRINGWLAVHISKLRTSVNGAYKIPKSTRTKSAPTRVRIDLTKEHCPTCKYRFNYHQRCLGSTSEALADCEGRRVLRSRHFHR